MLNKNIIVFTKLFWPEGVDGEIADTGHEIASHTATHSILTLLNKNKNTCIEVYHLAGATRINRYNFAKLVAQIFNLDKNLILPTTSDKILHNKPLNIKGFLKKLRREFKEKYR